MLSQIENENKITLFVCDRCEYREVLREKRLKHHQCPYCKISAALDKALSSYYDDKEAA